ncbi:uncharacterized protein LOC118655624 isoform X2 [Myotis myotis]|uniref:uncharacterized protein LOC118655624 isoform X2 n=1 Tax=Myotis myotis TaxID=51298 RepID=UPI00174980AA|nr:uncharacterized protein LOC118655624 isoform X2 [Myotis myotis]XP_036163545.1 uncharacterized protein LOC118655624 isoform X2 [Myotis myotis]
MQAVASPQPRSSKLPVRSCPLSEHLSGSAPGSHQPPSEKLPPHWALSCSLPVPALTSPRKLATLAPTQPHGTSDPALSSESPQNAACGAAAGGTCGGNRYHPCWPRSDPGSSGVDGGWRPGRTQMLSFSGGFSSRRSTPRADAVVRRGCPKRQHCKLKCQDPGRSAALSRSRGGWRRYSAHRPSPPSERPAVRGRGYRAFQSLMAVSVQQRRPVLSTSLSLLSHTRGPAPLRTPSVLPSHLDHQLPLRSWRTKRMGAPGGGGEGAEAGTAVSAPAGAPRVQGASSPC